MKRRSRVVIIGGSFAGASLARALSTDLFDVTVIDNKKFFEYIPGALRGIVSPDELSELCVPVENCAHSRFFRLGTVTDVDVDNFKVVIDNKDDVAYDYLCVCSGTNYPEPIIKDHPPTLQQHRDQTFQEHAALLKCKRVVLIGGGAVGVELAAEIVESTPAKVTIVTAAMRLLMECPSKAGVLALEFLQSRGVEVIFGERAVRKENDDGSRCVVLSSGETIQADKVYVCTGVCAQGSFLPDQCKDSRGYVLVNRYLQVVGGKGSVFACGDCISITDYGVFYKTAANAELTAHIVAANLTKIAKARARHCCGDYTGGEGPQVILEPVPSPAPFVMCVSLGRYNGILMFNNCVFSGMVASKLAAAAKAFIQKTKLNEIQGGILGGVTWKIGDAVTLRLHKCIGPLDSIQGH